MDTKQNLMISYSRRQTPFVDYLAAELEHMGYPVWLDYHSLVPAQPWYQQIEAGICGADAILLIVSKDSMQSRNVEPEWKLALQLERRIILLIFEAFPLPAELQCCEWVDFRVNHKKSLQQLKKLLESPPGTATSPAPQSGFKAPKRFWLALVLSVAILIGSLPAWWTLVVPYILVPLPWRIYKRDYNFSHVVPVLFLLPLISLFTSASFIRPGNILYVFGETFGYWSFYVVVLTSWPLLGFLLAPTMQRRATPEAARVRFAHPLVIDTGKPRPVLFAIDHAPEDGRYAEDLSRGLERYGHRLAESGESPEAVFILISTYKKDTEYDPDHQAVYPILLQAVGDIAPKLQRIQWIDFRKGTRNVNKLAQLLPEPGRLLKALAVAPAGTQEIFPMPVNALQYFYLAMGIMGVGGLLTTILSFGNLILGGQVSIDQLPRLFLAVLYGILLFGAVSYSVRGLRSRRGGTAAFYPLLVLTIFQVIIYVLNFFVVVTVAHLGNEDLRSLVDRAANGTGYTAVVLILGMLITLPMVLFGWRELYRWLPRRQDNTVGRLERMLLLYTPLQKPALIFHALFHMFLFIMFILLVLLIGDINSGVCCVMSPFLLFALVSYWLARRMST